MEATEMKKKRRSRANNDGRSHNCECGKSYFSYQALYTHKKTKHSDTIPLEDVPKKKRGRPKLNKESVHEDRSISPRLSEDFVTKRIKTWNEGENKGTCDDIFVEYVLYKRKKLSEAELASLSESINTLRNCINEHYLKVDPNNFLENELDYTTNEKPTMIPNISNFYMIDYLPNHKPDYEKEKEIQFMLEFCKWLNDKNYTDLEIAISP